MGNPAGGWNKVLLVSIVSIFSKIAQRMSIIRLWLFSIILETSFSIKYYEQMQLSGMLTLTSFVQTWLANQMNFAFHNGIQCFSLNPVSIFSMNFGSDRFSGWSSESELLFSDEKVDFWCWLVKLRWLFFLRTRVFRERGFFLQHSHCNTMF